MGAFVLPQIPDFDGSVLVAGDQLTLVGMDQHFVDGTVVLVISLHRRTADVPHLDCSILA